MTDITHPPIKKKLRGNLKKKRRKKSRSKSHVFLIALVGIKKALSKRYNQNLIHGAIISKISDIVLITLRNTHTYTDIRTHTHRQTHTPIATKFAEEEKRQNNF